MSSDEDCLNPCFNGIQMEHIVCVSSLFYDGVLILVLMEYKWNVLMTMEATMAINVLILVLMEYKWNHHFLHRP